MMGLLRKFVADEKGLETVEYALIAGLILVLSVATIHLIGANVATIFGNVQTKTQEAVDAGN